MDVSVVARQVGVKETEVLSKARELMRLASVRITGGLGPGEVCKAAVCLELACATSTMGCQPPRDKFVRFGCTTAKTYQAAFNMLQKALEVQPAANLQDLAVKLDATHLLEPVRQLMALYKTRFLNRLAAAGPGGASVDFSRPVFVAAAFHIVGRLKKVKIDGRKLCASLAVTPADFRATVAAYEEVCADVVTPAQKSRPAAGKKQGKAEDEEEEAGTSEEGSPESSVKQVAKRPRASKATADAQAGRVGAGKKATARTSGRKRSDNATKGAEDAAGLTGRPDHEAASGEESGLPSGSDDDAGSGRKPSGSRPVKQRRPRLRSGQGRGQARRSKAGQMGDEAQEEGEEGGQEGE
ncbi:hypothetical protein V8C86DRAFT_2630496 [Haematococcus lacustris]